MTPSGRRQRDLAYTVRMLARRPTLTLTAVMTLALGVGANTAIFSVVNGVLLAPLPYPHADRLVLIEEARADGEPGTTGYLSFDDVRRIVFLVGDAPIVPARFSKARRHSAIDPQTVNPANIADHPLSPGTLGQIGCEGERLSTTLD